MAQTEEQKRLWTETLKAALAATEQAKQAGTNPQVAARKAAAAVISAATPQKTDWVQETAKQLAPATGKDKYKATTTDDNLVDTTKAMARDQQYSPKAKAYAAEKEHQDYLKSDEYKQRIAEQEKKVNQDRIMQGILTGNADIAAPAVVQDDKELRLRNEAQQARAAVDAEADAKVMSTDLTDILSMTPEERRQLEQYAAGRDVDYFNTLNFNQNGIQVGTAEKNAAGLIAKSWQKAIPVRRMPETPKWSQLPDRSMATNTLSLALRLPLVPMPWADLWALWTMPRTWDATTAATRLWTPTPWATLAAFMPVRSVVRFSRTSREKTPVFGGRLRLSVIRD